MSSSSSIKALEELRRLRGGRGGRDVSIAATIDAVANNAAQTQKKLGELIEIWERHVPPTICERTALTGIRNGVLQVIVDSSASAFELDRLLRGGMLQALIREYRGTLLRVKWRIAGEGPARAAVKTKRVTKKK